MVFDGRLYDAAKWYGEHELIKLMKEFDFNKWDIPDITLWFQARTYLADADLTWTGESGCNKPPRLKPA
ncbi:MAG: hypothetical protein R3B83_05950 [Nitrospirales bacterium]|nr:hypothetical protein [Nitrospirales bacterium]